MTRNSHHNYFLPTCLAWVFAWALFPTSALASFLERTGHNYRLTHFRNARSFAQHQAVSTPAKSATSSGVPAFLRINQYYLLFTNPIVPHLDTSGQMIVSLKPFCDLIGLKCQAKTNQSKNGRGQALLVTQAGHSAWFTAGSRSAIVDGKSMPMPIAPRWVKTLLAKPLRPVYIPGVSASRQAVLNKDLYPKMQMLIPVSVLIKAFHLQSNWQPVTRTLTISVKVATIEMQKKGKTAFLPAVTASMWAENIDRFEQPDPNADDLRPVSISVQTGSHQVPQLVLRVQNTSDHDLPTYINLIGDTQEFSGYELGSPDVPAPPRFTPEIKAGAEGEVRNEIVGPRLNYLGYEVAWLVVPKPRN